MSNESNFLYPQCKFCNKPFITLKRKEKRGSTKTVCPECIVAVCKKRKREAQIKVQHKSAKAVDQWAQTLSRFYR